MKTIGGNTWCPYQTYITIGVTPTAGTGNKGYNDGPKVNMKNALTEIAQSDTIPLALIVKVGPVSTQ